MKRIFLLFIQYFFFAGGQNPSKQNPMLLTQQIFEKQMVDEHNILRWKHSAGNLTLTDELNRTAQKYAQTLALTRKFHHSGILGIGENLFLEESHSENNVVNGSFVTRLWYDEIEFYDFQKPSFNPKTGHFTQVVWKNTTKIGVGIAKSLDRRMTFVVAHYFPPGNFRTAYRTNVLPPRNRTSKIEFD